MRWPSLAGAAVAALILGAPARSDAQEPSPSPELPPEEVAPPISPDHVTFRILPFASVDMTSRSEDSGHAGFSIGPFDRTVNGHVRDDADYPLKW